MAGKSPNDPTPRMTHKLLSAPPDTWEWVKTTAAAVGMNPSEFIRYIIDKAREQEAEDA
jgi:hypothetical protein